jgi:hypothetical protein
MKKVRRLPHREAHTPDAAADALDYLVSALRLRPDPGSTLDPGVKSLLHLGPEVT